MTGKVEVEATERGLVFNCLEGFKIEELKQKDGLYIETENDTLLLLHPQGDSRLIVKSLNINLESNNKRGCYGNYILTHDSKIIVGECFEYKVGKGECKTEVVSSFALLSRQEAERKLIGKISEVMEKQSAMGKTEQIESV
ncbi:MAG: hypothetical protein HUT38_02315 [Candidatus Paceibacter sp.]|nr:hypothetical protein [Candidatus Paceibacter sp.]